MEMKMRKAWLIVIFAVIIISILVVTLVLVLPMWQSKSQNTNANMSPSIHTQTLLNNQNFDIGMSSVHWTFTVTENDNITIDLHLFDHYPQYNDQKIRFYITNGQGGTWDDMTVTTGFKISWIVPSTNSYTFFIVWVSGDPYGYITLTRQYLD